MERVLNSRFLPHCGGAGVRDRSDAMADFGGTADVAARARLDLLERRLVDGANWNSRPDAVARSHGHGAHKPTSASSLPGALPSGSGCRLTSDGSEEGASSAKLRACCVGGSACGTVRQAINDGSGGLLYRLRLRTRTAAWTDPAVSELFSSVQRRRGLRNRPTNTRSGERVPGLPSPDNAQVVAPAPVMYGAAVAIGLAITPWLGSSAVGYHAASAK
jgi:hypothetical protein